MVVKINRTNVNFLKCKRIHALNLEKGLHKAVYLSTVMIIMIHTPVICATEATGQVHNSIWTMVCINSSDAQVVQWDAIVFKVWKDKQESKKTLSAMANVFRRNAVVVSSLSLVNTTIEIVFATNPNPHMTETI